MHAQKGDGEDKNDLPIPRRGVENLGHTYEEIDEDQAVPQPVTNGQLNVFEIGTKLFAGSNGIGTENIELPDIANTGETKPSPDILDV